MAKTVSTLKKKHRDRIWKDEEGDLWFWHTEVEKWVVLMGSSLGGFYVSYDFSPEYYNRFVLAHTSPMAV